MTRPPSLGPVVAAAAATVALAAIVIGFMLVGGPGDARDRRLDQMTSHQINQVVAVAQCAFDSTGLAPVDVKSASNTRRPPSDEHDYGDPTCGSRGAAYEFADVDATPPTEAGEVSYEATGANTIKVCGLFRTEGGDEPDYPYPAMQRWGVAYDELNAPHPVGLYCYELDLVRSNRSTDPSQAPGAEAPPEIP